MNRCETGFLDHLQKHLSIRSIRLLTGESSQLDKNYFYIASDHLTLPLHQKD